MDNYEGKFIGPDRIKSIELSDRKTFSGKDVYKIIYRNEKVDYFSEKALKNIVTEKSRDLTELRDLKCFPVVKEMLEILAESNVKLRDIEYILERTSLSIQDNIKKAADVLWKKEFDARDMMDIEEILQEKNEK